MNFVIDGRMSVRSLKMSKQKVFKRDSAKKRLLWRGTGIDPNVRCAQVHQDPALVNVIGKCMGILSLQMSIVNLAGPTRREGAVWKHRRGGNDTRVISRIYHVGIVGLTTWGLK